MFASIRRRISSMRRYNQILRVLMRYGYQDIVKYMEENRRFSFLRRFIPRSTRRIALQYNKWERMRLVCEELGPTFVKFGQILSNRPDLIPMDLAIELEKLQDSVPPMPEKEARRAVERELKDSVQRLFAWFEPTPFASASMAQVHRATLLDGERVALKVQRPGIEKVIREDIKVMYRVAEILEKRLPSVRSFDPVGLVENFEKSILKELDFINESINVQRFRINLENDKGRDQYAYAPKVFQEYTTPRLLTLEFIQGTKISRLRTLEQKGHDHKVIANRLAVSYFKQIFEYGFFHADPHPGNLLVLADGRICYLDFGMMGSILTKDLELFGQLFLSISRKEVRQIIKALLKLSDNAPVRRMRELEFDVNELVQKYAARDMHKNEMSTVLMELKDIITKYGLKVPTHFFLLGRSLVTVEGVIRHLDKDLDQLEMAKPYLIKAVARKLNPLKMAEKFLNTMYEFANYMEEFPQDLRTAIRKINSGEVRVDLRHQGIDPLVHTITRVTKQIITTLVITALLVSGTLLIIYKVHPFWWGTSAWGISALVTGILLAVGMLRNIAQGMHDDWEGWQR